MQTAAIFDFDPATEKVDVSLFGFVSFTDLMSHAAENEDGVDITLPGPNGHDAVLTMGFLSRAELHAHNFIL